jgi:hypothetical protein
MKIIYNEENENENLKVVVNGDGEMKSWLVDYVGEKTKPEGDSVTLEMIVDTMAEEFPEFLFAVAEENFIRGYKQAVTDTQSVTATREEEEDEEFCDNPDLPQLSNPDVE